jgi:cytochrome c553
VKGLSTTAVTASIQTFRFYIIKFMLFKIYLQNNMKKAIKPIFIWLSASLATLWSLISAAAPAVEDTMAQRVQACTACHGAQGKAGPDGYYPRIAGKPAGYLYNQLMHFRDGNRNYRLMTHMVEPLSPTYLHELATHFANVSLPYPPPSPVAATAQALARGEQLARVGDKALQVPACVACHGTALTGVQPHTPGLVGLPRDYINSQLGAWQSGARRAASPDCMADIARSLTPTDVSAVSAWLASQPLPADTRPVASLPEPPPLKCGVLMHPAAQPARTTHAGGKP